MNLLSCRQIRSYRFSAEATAMILSDVFERFAQDSPLTVMARGRSWRTPSTRRSLDQLFEDVARQQYTHKLLFSTVVDLMSVVVCRIRPSINAALQGQGRDPRRHHRGRLRQARPHRDRRIGRAGPTGGRSAGAGHRRDGRRRAPWLPGYHVRILDGNHLPGHRAPAQGVADHPRRRPARSGAGRARPPADAGHRRDPLRGRPRAGAVAAGPGPGDRRGQGPLDRRPQLLHDRLPLRDRRTGRRPS